MGRDYYFYMEARFQGKWYNIDPWIMTLDGKLMHTELYQTCGSGIGILYDEIGGRMDFSEISESTRNILINDYANFRGNFNGPLDLAEAEEIVSGFHYCLICSLEYLEVLANQPKQNEFFVTKHQIEMYEKQGKDIEEFLTARQLLDLPEQLRGNYVLYEWDGRDTRTLNSLITLGRDRLNRFKDYIWFQHGATDQEYDQIRARFIVELSY